MSGTTDLAVTVASVLDQISPVPEQRTVLDPMVTLIVHTLASLAGTTHRKATRLESLRDVERKVLEAHPHIAPELIRAAMIVGRDLTLGADDPDLPLLGAKVRHCPTPSPLTRTLLAQAALADRVEHALIDWLKASPDQPDTAESHAGVAVLLAMLRGGLTESTTLNDLLDRPLKDWLSDGLGEPGELTQELPWLSLPPLVTLTLASFAARHPKVDALGTALTASAKTPMAALEDLLARVMPAPPPTVEALQAGVRARVRRDAPDWLVRLMDGSIDDATVTTATRRRLTLDMAMAGGPLTPEKLGERPATTKPLPGHCSVLPRPSATQSFLANLIRAIKASKSTRDVADVLARALPEAPCVIGALLVALAQHWTGSSAPVRPTSIARYLSALRYVPAASSLLVPFRRDDQGMLSADPVAWAQMLRTAASPALCRDLTTPRELARLHSFASGIFPILRDADGGLLKHLRELGGSPEKRTALITDREVARASAELARRTPHARNEQLLLEVAYATFARRDELAQTRLSNLVERQDGRMLLTLRRHGTHRLKTRYSRRDLPLHRLLGEATLARLRQQAQMLRSLHRPPDDVFLFGDLARPEEPPPDGAFQRIVEAMRHVTGDLRLTFHSLRHAGITWAFLRLLSKEIPLLRTCPFPGMDAEGWTHERCQALLETLCPEHHQAPAGYLPRDWLRGLARLAGHGPPDTLLKHYQHLRPLFQWAVLDRYFPVEWPLELLDKLAAIHPRKRQRLQARWGADGDPGEDTGTVAHRLWQERQRPMREALRKALQRPTDAIVDTTATHWPALLPTALVPMVFHLRKSGFSSTEIAEIMEVDPRAIVTVDAACSKKIAGKRYAPALDPVWYFVRHEDRLAFHTLAQRLDALPHEPRTAEAWRQAFHVHGRWAWADGTLVHDAIEHLVKALPDDGVLILECQPLPAAPEGTATDALAALVAMIDSKWRDRLNQKPLKAADTPKWRNRPTFAGATCWFYLRIGKRNETLRTRKDARQPDQTVELNERSVGYTGAVNAWLLRQDLRDVKWQLTRRDPDYDALLRTAGDDAAASADEPA